MNKKLSKHIRKIIFARKIFTFVFPSKKIKKLKNAAEIEKILDKRDEIYNILAGHNARYNIFNSIKDKITQTKSCPICLEDFNNITQVITRCGHLVCGICATSLFANKNTTNCHICRETLFKKDLEVVENKHLDLNDDVNKWGTKMSRLIEYLKEILQNDDHRVIIFSQWDRMLKMIANVLKESSVNHVFINGSIHVVNSKILKFKIDKSIKVVLLSSDKASSGLNLTEATHIVLLDTFNTDKESSKVIEQQAIGRAVRIGQKKNVFVKRFIMKDTIEEEYYNAIYK